jgi:hypothetical protein
VDDGILVLVLAMAIAVALIADGLVTRFSRRAVWLAALATVVAVMAYATIGWLGEPAGAHATNPQLTRATDWFGHVGGFGAAVALPVLVGLGVAATLPRGRIPRLLRVAITSGVILLSAPVGVVLMLTVGVSIYHDGP